MILRDARPGDRARIEGFLAALQDFERETEALRRPGAEMAKRHLAMLEGWAARPPAGGSLIAEIDGSPAGWLLFGCETEPGALLPDWARTYGVLSDLWVMPEHRGQGVARALIAEAETRLAKAGIARVEITAIASNPRALALYRHLGFADYCVTLGKRLSLPSGDTP
ncbi:MAG: GNAT family N-acetyltransferase [Pseudomonadota bacterium]